MANLNRVFLMGNLTRDLELKYGKNGQPVTNLRLAVNRTYTTQSGERKEEVCFVTIVVWGKQAESCHTYLKKGSAVFAQTVFRNRTPVLLFFLPTYSRGRQKVPKEAAFFHF